MRISRRIALKLLVLGAIFRKSTFWAFAENRFGTEVVTDFLTRLTLELSNQLQGDTLNAFPRNQTRDFHSRGNERCRGACEAGRR